MKENLQTSSHENAPIRVSDAEEIKLIESTKEEGVRANGEASDVKIEERIESKYDEAIKGIHQICIMLLGFTVDLVRMTLKMRFNNSMQFNGKMCSSCHSIQFYQCLLTLIILSRRIIHSNFHKFSANLLPFKNTQEDTD